MIIKKVIVKNESGLGARAAAHFVQCANEFLSDIFIEKDTKRVNAKSIIGVMSLGLEKGESIFLVIDGPDEEDSMKKLVQLIEEPL